jgi:hypothetical protein
VARLEIYVVYAPAVAPPEIQTTIVSFAETELLLSVNDTAVFPANATLAIVIRPADLFSVTAVLLSVSWVTAP